MTRLASFATLTSVFLAACAVTTAARFGNELARSMAFRTGLLNGEKPLLQAYLAAALAGGAGFRLGSGLGS